MDLNKYALFVDVADTKNFTKSGERLGYTQPGVSHILKGLENELGFSLFERTHQGARLTPNAEKILPIVRNLLSVNEQLHQTVDSLNGLQSGHITIASYSSIACTWLPGVLHTYKKLYPGVDIELMEGGTDEILEWLETNKADFGLFSKRHSDSLEWIPLYEDPYVAVLPYNDPESKAVFFLVSNFSGKPFILSCDGIDYDVHKILSDNKITPDVQFTCRDNYSIISMVESHLGISILPELVLGGNSKKVKGIPLQPSYSRKIGIGMRSKNGLSPAATQFIDVLLDNLPNFSK